MNDNHVDKAFWKALRQFLRSGKGGGIAGAFPAALAPFRDKPSAGQGYPCWIGDQAVPVRDLLRNAVAQIGEPIILRDNLARLDQIILSICSPEQEPLPAAQVWEESLQKLQEQLNVAGAEAETFKSDLKNFHSYLPREGAVAPFSSDTPLYMLSGLISARHEAQNRSLEETSLPLRARLQEMLAVEREKSPEAHSAKKLQGSLDFADRFLNFEELSGLIPSSATDAMPADRLARLEQTLAILNEGLSLDPVFISGNQAPLEAAIRHFDESADRAAQYFAALRIAKLERDNHYNPDIHDDFFAHFSWRLFSETELDACPPVVCSLSTETLLGPEWAHFSELLASRRPVKMLVFKKTLSGGSAFRQEPGALAIAHRDAFVFQTACVDPATLFEGLKKGLETPYPAVMHLLEPDPAAGILANSAAVEGREFPGFQYDCRKGPSWGARFSIADNPDPESAWPGNSFTFADYAALDPAFHEFFQLIPEAQWTDELLSVSAYLGLPASERYARIPYIDMVDAEGKPAKAAVAWPLIEICQERLDFWRYLQENAGVSSYHVSRATEQLRAELEAQRQKELDSLRAAHAAELEEARETAGREAMERLSALLLDLDLDGAPAPAAPKPAAKAAAPAPPPPAAEEKEAPAPKPAAPVLAAAEPWVESNLCTSCDECINVNDKMFKYDGSKHAYIADPKAGTFAQLVKAAENCPVVIIHPGAPLNPNEPGLEELVKRAEKFN
jgi:ferredoxin